MLEIHAKIGTGPGKVIWVRNKRKLPVVGERIEFRRFPYVKRGRWEYGAVDEIKNLGNGETLYMVRMA